MDAIKNIKDTGNSKKSLQLSIVNESDNNYILNDIVWFNPAQPSVLKRQISEKSNTNDIIENISIDQLITFFDGVK
jgi:hypothetical protein